MKDVDAIQVVDVTQVVDATVDLADYSEAVLAAAV